MLRLLLLSFIFFVPAHGHQTWHEPNSVFIVVIDDKTVGLSHDPNGHDVFYTTPFAHLPLLHMAMASALSLDVPLAVDPERSWVGAGSLRPYHFLIDSRFIMVDVDDDRKISQYWFKKGTRTFKLYTSASKSDDFLSSAVNEAQLWGDFVNLLALQVIPKWHQHPDILNDACAFDINFMSNVRAEVVVRREIVRVDMNTKPLEETKQKTSLLKRIFSRTPKKNVAELSPYSPGQNALIHQLTGNSPDGTSIACIQSRCPDKSDTPDNSRGSCFIVGPSLFAQENICDPFLESAHNNNEPSAIQRVLALDGSWVL